MNKAEILQYLTDKQIPFTKYEHEPIFSVEEGDKSNLPNREKVIRNLFLCDAKKKNFYLVSLFVHKNINLKELSEKIPSKRLSFAKQEAMEQMLEVKPGSVTPLAILNNKDKNILMILVTLYKKLLIVMFLFILLGIHLQHTNSRKYLKKILNQMKNI